MIESDRHRAKEPVKIDESFVRDGIVQVGTPTLVEIDHDLEAIEQDMLLDCFENLRRRYCFLFFALCGAASR